MNDPLTGMPLYRISLIIAFLLIPFAASPDEPGDAVGAATDSVQTVSNELTLDAVFKDDLFGKTPDNLVWSGDGRYLAYRWNVKDATGVDVWVYDTESEKSYPVTSAERFAEFDRDAWRIVHQSSADEKKKSEDQFPQYAGVSRFIWAPTSPEMIVSYRDDLYRIFLQDDRIERLTHTSDDESIFDYTPDERGYLYRRGGNIYRSRFGDSLIEEIKPELPDGVSIDRISASPDQQWWAITTRKSGGDRDESRRVGYVSYRERFAEFKYHNRNLAEDDWNPAREMTVYLCPAQAPVNQATPSYREVFRCKEEDGPVYISQPDWSEDGGKFVFGVYQLQTDEVRILQAKVGGTGEAEQIHQSKRVFTRGSRPYYCQPFYVLGGNRVVDMFDDNGFMQPWVLDPLTYGKYPLLDGNFNALPVDVDTVDHTLYVTANREHPIQYDLYSIDLRDKSLNRITSKQGRYFDSAVHEASGRFAANFTNWQSPPELVVGSMNVWDEKTITDSHDEEWEFFTTVQPQLVSFANRHGQQVHGYVFLPTDWTKADQRPLLMYTYGGPLNIESGGKVVYGSFAGDTYRFPMFMTQKHGYVCAVIAPRGTSGYGERFENANYKKPGVAQTEDLTDAVNYLIAEYGVDRERTSLWGWSFGGFQTQMVMYTEPDVFKAGIAGAGPTQWENYYGSYTEYVIGEADEMKEDSMTFSLIPLAKNLKGRLLLHHGMEDTNVLVQDTIKVYQALLQAGKGPLVELLLDTSGGHGSGGGANADGDLTEVQRYTIYEQFLLRNLGE